MPHFEILMIFFHSSLVDLIFIFCRTDIRSEIPMSNLLTSCFGVFIDH